MTFEEWMAKLREVAISHGRNPDVVTAVREEEWRWFWGEEYRPEDAFLSDDYPGE